MAPTGPAPTPLPISATELCRRLQDSSDAATAIQQVDVREDSELDLARLNRPVLHLPLGRSQDWVERIDVLLDRTRPVAVLCHAGVRSWHFGCWLIQEHAFAEVWNVQGGIDAWSVEVDGSVPRY
ncbi:MAG: rhodanese-like domain-containing protein [Cyanobium sp.]